MSYKEIELLIELLKTYKKQSECKKRRVGCFIVKNGSIVSSGYNRSMNPNIPCEYIVSRCDKCNIEFKDKERCKNCGDILNNISVKTSDYVLHAEEVAIYSAIKNGISLKDSDMVVTTLPCINCSKLIINSGISKVYYHKEYKNEDGLNLLKEFGVDVIRVD